MHPKQPRVVSPGKNPYPSPPRVASPRMDPFRELKSGITSRGRIRPVINVVSPRLNSP